MSFMKTAEFIMKIMKIIKITKMMKKTVKI